MVMIRVLAELIAMVRMGAMLGIGAMLGYSFREDPKWDWGYAREGGP